MDKSQPDIILRGPKMSDIDIIHKMIVESTDGRTKITPSNLRNDLLAQSNGQEVKSSECCINFDIKLLKSNRPVAQAILAEVNNRLVGYLIFHYYYSPWSGHSAFIDDVFIVSDYRKKGIARKLLQEISKISKKEILRMLIFNVGNVNRELMDNILKSDPYWIRNDQKDWSVYRLSYFSSCNQA